MTVDILLLSTPNKNIDYPGLSLPVLTGTLRRAGYTVDQQDLNVLLRDRVLTHSGLSNLMSSSIPFYAERLRHSERELRRLLLFYRYLANLNDKYGFASLETIKQRAQAREYQWLCETEDRFQQFIALFKINRALHYLIEIAVAASYDATPDYLTSEVVGIIDRTCATIAAKRPLLVGLSVLGIQRAFALRLLKTLRSGYGGVLAVGGPDPTRFARCYIEHCPEVDLVFVREAEVSLVAVMSCLEKGRTTFDGVPGVLYRNSAGCVVQNHHSPVDLSGTASPDFRGLPLDLYLTPALPVQASRGCYWQKCRFCIHWDTYCDFRTRSPHLVVQDIKTAMQQHGAKYFHFTDDCIPVAHARELTMLIHAHSLDIRWLAYFRFEDGLDRSVLSELYSAGCRVLEMGLESASQRVLSLMRKNIVSETATRIIRDAAAIGLMVKVFMFHGYPGEKPAELLKTVELTEEHLLAGRIRPFLSLRNRFALLRGSDIYDAVVAGSDEGIARLWNASGLFAIGTEYELSQSEEESQQIIAGHVARVQSFMEKERVYSTDDDNVMLDLIVLEHSPLQAGWRCM